MARSVPLLTESAVEERSPLYSRSRPKQRKGGRPWIENRRVLEGILWILRSGARWQDLPEKFPHPSTCWRRLRDWEERGRLVEHLAVVSERVEPAPAIEVERVVSGREFCSGEKKGAAESEKTKRGKGDEVDGGGRRARVFLWETTFTLHPRRKSNLRETTLASIRVGRRPSCGPARGRKPLRVIADKAYDSDPLRKAFAASRDPTDLPAQKESRSAGDPGRSSSAAL